MSILNPFNYLCPVCQCYSNALLKYQISQHSIYNCPKCGFLFLYPQPNRTELHTIYQSETYFHNIHFYNGDCSFLYGYSDYIAERFNKQRQFKYIVNNCYRFLHDQSNNQKLKDPTLLEIGCGPGFFLETAQQLGFQIRGIEFNQKILSHCSDNVRSAIEWLDFEKYPPEGNDQYHCIVMLDVIEHFLKPWSVLNSIHRLIRSDGLLVISTMDSSSNMSRLLGKRLEDFRRVREHMYFFNRNTIKRMLNNHGFHIIKISFIGHTFRMDHLCHRLSLIMPFMRYHQIIPQKWLQKLSIYINPRTKMIIYAKPKKGLSVTQFANKNAIHTDLEVMKSEKKYYQHLLQPVHSYFANKRILELGCGFASATVWLQQIGARKIIAIDKDPACIQIASKTCPDVNFYCLNIEKEFRKICDIIKQYQVDIVFSFNVMEHIQNDRRLIYWIYKALPKNGLCISVLPSDKNLYNDYDLAYQHYRRYDPIDCTVRFYPFILDKIYQSGLFRYMGWKCYKYLPYRGLKTPWNLYHKLFFKWDCFIDNLFKYRLPKGGSMITIHRKPSK